MEKVGILTVHHNCNYGAVLQAYATQKKLCDLGCDAKLINYINPQAKKTMQLFGGSVTDKIRALLNLKRKSKRIRAFKAFMKSNYRLSGDAIYEANQLCEDLFGYDIYMTGSDQTFNLKLSGDVNFRKNYFLPFVKNGKKISYAASMGEKMKELSQEEKAWMKSALEDYTALSVRETVAADFIENLGVERPQVVIDPTMILNRADWDAVCKPTKFAPGSYILFYSVLSDAWVIERVKEVAQKLGLKVVAPHHQNRFEMGAPFVRADDAGPGEFISLIKNAAFVCTTSFHATVFSILYNKPFVSFVLGEGNRIGNLLNITNLTERALREKDVVSEKLFEAYADVNALLAPHKEASEKFLKDAIGEEL